MSRRVAILFLFALLFSACAPASVQTPEVLATVEATSAPTEVTATSEATVTLIPSPAVEVETQDPTVWELVGENGEIAVRGIDLTLWPGTEGEQKFAVNPEYAGQLRRAMLMHIYAVNWAADEVFKARYTKFEDWEEAIDAEPEKLWDIYLDEPHPGSYSSGEWGTVQPVKVRQPVSLKSLSLELVAPEKARPLVDRKGGYTMQQGYFDYQFEVVIGPGNVPMVQLNFTSDLSEDRAEFAQTAIKPGASVEANTIMWVMGLNIFEYNAEWMAGGFGGDEETRVIMDGGAWSIDTTRSTSGITKTRYEAWAQGEEFVVPR